MLGGWFCERMKRDMDIRQAETRSSGQFTGTSVNEPIRDACSGCCHLSRTESGFEMKFPIVAHCRMQNGNCKRKWCQGADRHNIRNAAKSTLENIKPVKIATSSS